MRKILKTLFVQHITLLHCLIVYFGLLALLVLTHSIKPYIHQSEGHIYKTNNKRRNQSNRCSWVLERGIGFSGTIFDREIWRNVVFRGCYCRYTIPGWRSCEYYALNWMSLGVNVFFLSLEDNIGELSCSRWCSIFSCWELQMENELWREKNRIFFRWLMTSSIVFVRKTPQGTQCFWWHRFYFCNYYGIHCLP